MIRKKCTYKKIKINKKITARLVQSSSIVLFMIIVGLCAFGLDKNDMIEPKVESSVAAAGAECDVEATLYNNSSYSGAGVKLTESGATVSGWDRNDSKFLNVDVSIEKGNKATFVVEVVLPKQLYVVGTDIDYVPSGFKKVTFQHNGSMKVNGDAQVYNYHENSGTLRYVVERKKNASIELAQIKLELRYDDAFWDNMANSSIVEAGTNPIEVRIKKGETSTTYDKNIIEYHRYQRSDIYKYKTGNQ
jgi:hypothetical protein